MNKPIQVGNAVNIMQKMAPEAYEQINTALAHALVESQDAEQAVAIVVMVTPRKELGNTVSDITTHLAQDGHLRGSVRKTIKWLRAFVAEKSKPGEMVN